MGSSAWTARLRPCPRLPRWQPSTRRWSWSMTRTARVVLGLGGRGISHHFGLLGQVDVEVGTLSKAFGVIGGYVAGRQGLIEYLKQRARPYLFSSATTAAVVAAGFAAVGL